MWSLLMGNSSSSDEIDQECPDEDTSKLKSSRLTNHELNKDEGKVPFDSDPSVANESTEINVVRIGSFHQPVKVTKIKSINGPNVNTNNLEAASRPSRDYYKLSLIHI